MKKILVGLFVSLCFIFTAAPVAAAMPFNDVKSSDWFYESVEYVYNHNLFEGTGYGQFSPNGSMTRGMFVTVLGRLYGVDTSAYTENHFSDVIAGEWYAPYVQWAYENGITDGISADYFGVNDKVSREQMAKFIRSYLNYIKFSPPAVSYTYNFEDESSISSYAKYYVHNCQGYGLLLGKGNNLFDPQGNSTRAEVATVFERLNRAIHGERLILYYSGTTVPTYDSVTSNFAYISAFQNSDRYVDGYYPLADTFVYYYNSDILNNYCKYLSDNDFTMVMSEYVDGNYTIAYQKDNDYVVIVDLWTSEGHFSVIGPSKN